MSTPVQPTRWSAGGIATILVILAAIVFGIAWGSIPHGHQRPTYWREDEKAVQNQCGNAAMAAMNIDAAYMRGDVASYPSIDDPTRIQTVNEVTGEVHCFVAISPDPLPTTVTG